MKLINLRIKNIASIEEAEIRFNEGVLANAPRFLICGDMGTGKSTILDSICLALYNNTPRLSQAPGDKHDYGIDNITAQDPRNLLRHGATDGSVELDFEGSDGKLYTATWLCGRTRNHTLRDVTHTLACGHETITNKKEIENRIKASAVGLDFHQFCRTTLLAQGQFTQFLKSKDNEKSEILEKLTQTDIYSLVGKEIALLRSENDKKLSTLEAEIRGARLLSDEVVSQLKNDITAYNEQLDKLKKQKETLEAKSHWLQRCSEAQAHCKEAEIQFQKLKTITESPAFQEEASLICDWNNSSDGRHLMTEQQTLEQELSFRKTDQTQKGKNAFETAQKELNHFIFTIEERKKTLSALQEQIAQEAAHSNMYEQSQTLILRLETIGKHREKSATLQQEEERLQAQLPTLEKKVEELTSHKETLSAQLKNIHEEELKLQEKLNELHPKQLEEQRDAIDQQLQQLQGFQTISTHLQQIHQKISDIGSQIDLNKKQQQEEGDRINQSQALAKERKKNLEEAKTALEKTKLALGDEADRLRAQLHLGDTCPICGNTIQHFQETESLQNILRPQQDNVKRAEEKLSDTESQIKASEKIIQKNKSELPSLEQKLADLREECTATEAKAQEQCQKFNLTLTDPDDTLAAINKCEETLKTQKENICQQLKSVEKTRDTLMLNQKNQQNLFQQIHQADIDLEKARQEVKNCKKDIEKYQYNLKEELENTEKEMNMVREKMTWCHWEQSWESEPATFLRRLQEASNNYTTNCQQASQQSHALELDEQRLKETQSIRNTILQQWPDWESNTTEQIAGTNIMEKWKMLEQKAHQLHVQIEDLGKRREEVHDKLNFFIAQHPALTLERLHVLSQLTENQLPISQHQQIEKELQASAGALKQAANNLNEVKQLPHPDIDSSETLEMMKEQIAGIEQETSQLGVALGEAHGQLKQNEQNEQAVAVKKQAFEKMQHTVEQWKKLSGLFGTKDGAAFRNVAQSFLLQNLVRSANEYLKELTQRYRLDCIPSTLTLSLRDMYQGEMVSPVDTLSGGESFLVSLSLALALSSINRKGFSIDTLFIDEGFGNLSSNELETVLNMLARLQKMNGKRVGVISHVDAVKEHIPVHVEVKRIDPTRSRIEVVDMTLKGKA